MTRGPDGRWTALDGQAMYRSKLAAGVVFQTVLRDELSRRLGVTWRPVHDHVADIAGIPQAVLTHFSKRRNEIEDELERTGRSGPAAAGAATLATRTAKVEVDQETLDQRWLDDADSIGYGPVDIDQLLAHCSPGTPTLALAPDTLIAVRTVDPLTGEVRHELQTIDAFAAAVAWDLPETNATVTRHEVHTAVADRLAASRQHRPARPAHRRRARPPRTRPPPLPRQRSLGRVGAAVDDTPVASPRDRTHHPVHTQPDPNARRRPHHRGADSWGRVG